MASDKPGRFRRAGRRVTDRAKKLEGNPKLLTGVKLLREMLPGDSRYGDPLSTAGPGGSSAAGRRLSKLTAERPSVLREAGMSALQVWQGWSEAQGRGHGQRDLAIVFTDLVEFSDWALQAGDDAALDLLRDVGQAIEPPVESRGGEVVKWLGDGMMAVFEDPQEGLAAVLEACERVKQVEADGYEAGMRAGMHFGRPRKLGGDYLGVEVTVAARIAEEGKAGEVLVSGTLLEKLDTSGLDVSRKRDFSVKGVPKDVEAYSIATG